MDPIVSDIVGIGTMLVGVGYFALAAHRNKEVPKAEQPNLLAPLVDCQEEVARQSSAIARKTLELNMLRQRYREHLKADRERNAGRTLP